MVKLFGDFKKFTFNLEGATFFNLSSFMVNRNPKNKQFYTEFTQSLNFRHFLQLFNDDGFELFEEYCRKFHDSLNFNRSLSTKFYKQSSGDVSTFRTHTRKLTNPCIFIDRTRPMIDLDQSNPHTDLKMNEPIESYLLAPYFINKEILRMDTFKIDEYIIDKYNPSILCERVCNHLDTNIDEPSSEVRRYILEKNILQKNKEITKKSSGTGIKNRSSSMILSEQILCNIKKQKSIKVPVRRKQSLLSDMLVNKLNLEDYQDQIKELSRDLMSLVLAGTPLMNENISDAQILLMSSIARDHFAKVLYQDKFKQVVF